MLPTNTLRQRSLGTGTLDAIQTAWSSPSNCVKSNWCRIPAIVIIAIGVMILFVIFCCCAQCLSCCCCRGNKRKNKRPFDDSELGSQRLLPNSGAFGRDLPRMPSYNMDELKKPTYAVIGDDGSVTTEGREKDTRDDFPSSARENNAFGVTYEPAPTTTPVRGDMFSGANASFHNSLLTQQVDTSYRSQQAGGSPSSSMSSSSAAPVPPYSVPQYPVPPRQTTGRTSPRRQQQQQQPLPFDQSSTYSQPPPSFASSLPRPGQDRPARLAQEIQPPAFNTSRGLFNAGGPFPIMAQTSAVAAAAANPNSVPTTAPPPMARPLPQRPSDSDGRVPLGTGSNPLFPLPAIRNASSRPGTGHSGGDSGVNRSMTNQPTLPSTDWLDEDEDSRHNSPAPYPTDAQQTDTHSHSHFPFRDNDNSNNQRHQRGGNGPDYHRF